MRFTDTRHALGVAVALLLAACSSPMAPDRAQPPPRSPAAPQSPSAQVLADPGSSRLAPAPTSRNWTEYRLNAARRIVAANPSASYTSKPPDPLLAIPVLEIEVNSDGSVRRIVVLREPRQARDTTKLAMDAVHRAAPFGDVSRLPKPWKFTETFLFDDDRRFKPRTLDD